MLLCIGISNEVAVTRDHCPKMFVAFDDADGRNGSRNLDSQVTTVDTPGFELSALIRIAEGRRLSF